MPGGRWRIHTVTAPIGLRGGIAATVTELAVNFMPPYFPGFNPTEQVWSRVKSWDRRESPPTFRRLVRSIGRVLSRVDRLEASNCVANSGHASRSVAKPL